MGSEIIRIQLLLVTYEGLVNEHMGDWLTNIWNTEVAAGCWKSNLGNVELEVPSIRKV